MKLGILGGTFNPIHHGHLFLAAEATAQLGLDRLLLMPNFLPPHRQEAVATGFHRYSMACLAAAGSPRLVASSLEVDRGQPSYTVDTVRALRELYPHARLTFVTGADALLRYPWKDLDDLLGMLECFLAATRPGFDLAQLEAHLDGLQLRHRGVVAPLHMPSLDISATEIRRRLASGQTVSFLVPAAVEDYIQKHGLYAAGG